MQTSKRQIFIVEQCNSIDQPIKVSMVTTCIRKLKGFIVKQIKNNPDVFYDNNHMSKSMQAEEFKNDWKYLTRDKINEKLYGIKYTYVYDGEEF